MGAFDLPGVAVRVGGTLSILRDLAPELALAAIAQERLTAAWLAPVMLGGILERPKRGAYNLESMRWAVVGARLMGASAPSRELCAGALGRCLRPDGKLQRRHHDGSGPRA